MLRQARQRPGLASRVWECNMNYPILFRTCWTMDLCAGWDHEDEFGTERNLQLTHNRSYYEQNYDWKQIPFDPSQGFPAAADLYYECGKCKDLVPSRPEDNVRCSCGSISVDVDAGRLSAKNEKALRLFRLTPKPGARG